MEGSEACVGWPKGLGAEPGVRHCSGTGDRTAEPSSAEPSSELGARGSVPVLAAGSLELTEPLT